MKNRKRKALRIIKWGALTIGAYWFITTLIFGHTNLDDKTGHVSFRWSGLDALFSSDEDFGFVVNEQYKTYLKGVDGPYIYGDVKFWVNQENTLIKEVFDRNKPIQIDVNNEDKDSFNVILQNSYEQDSAYYHMPDKLIAISDIEGNYNAFYSFLLNNKVINKHYDWIFGDGHLVLNGDFFDRGKQVNQVLWLIYDLERKAEAQGGKVHFINGNHEIMNLYGDISYADHRYIEIGKQISTIKDWSKATKHLYSETSELGKWLRTKNVIEKIGDYIFVHGGLNKKHIEANLSIFSINKIAKASYGKIPIKDSLNDKEKLVLGSHNSPYWDRSLEMGLMYKVMFFLNRGPTHKTTEDELDEILDFYNAKKIVIGHSVVDEVIADYNGKAIKIDVKHGEEKNSTNTQGLLIDKGLEYKINGLGEKEPI